ncbi:hypothetical protein [uncultured Mediterranean phage uvDeep1-CGR2-KM23-C896]|nr:hypothetical protein [uncultured Mediterranean phage uvDeep1-CGR2-KM23-C896]|tara:strand:+ start:1635 stop:2198 length:564 start_codon:yes stop_codon:yes gene_type:complete
MKNLQSKLVNVQATLKAPKNQRNNFGNYNYRSCEDILEAVKPILKKEGLTLMLSDSINNEPLYVTATATISDGTDSISVSAQAGIDPNKKGMDVAQSFGASSSYARKYALNGLFLIDDTKDADATNMHGKVSKKASTGTLEDNKQWLQKNSAQFNNVLKAIKEKGFTIADVRQKYKVSKEVEQLLTK